MNSFGYTPFPFLSSSVIIFGKKDPSDIQRTAIDNNDDDNVIAVAAATTSTKLSNSGRFTADNLMAAVASSNGQQPQRRFNMGGSDDEDDDIERPEMLTHGGGIVVSACGIGRDFSSNSPSPGRGSPSLSPERELDSPCADSSDENPVHQVS